MKDKYTDTRNSTNSKKDKLKKYQLRHMIKLIKTMDKEKVLKAVKMGMGDGDEILNIWTNSSKD